MRMAAQTDVPRLREQIEAIIASWFAVLSLAKTAGIGRPRIPREHTAFIRRISGDHPVWAEDEIAEALAARFGIRYSASTIREYRIPPSSPSPMSS